MAPSLLTKGLPYVNFFPIQIGQTAASSPTLNLGVVVLESAQPILPAQPKTRINHRKVLSYVSEKFISSGPAGGSAPHWCRNSRRPKHYRSEQFRITLPPRLEARRGHRLDHDRRRQRQPQARRRHALPRRRHHGRPRGVRQRRRHVHAGDEPRDSGEHRFRRGVANPVGAARAHGNAGAFVSLWTIDKATLEVLQGEDLLQNNTSIFLSNNDPGTGTAHTGYLAGGTTAIARLCSADLAPAERLRLDRPGHRHLLRHHRPHLPDRRGIRRRRHVHRPAAATSGRKARVRLRPPVEHDPHRRSEHPRRPVPHRLRDAALRPVRLGKQPRQPVLAAQDHHRRHGRHAAPPARSTSGSARSRPRATSSNAPASPARAPTTTSTSSRSLALTTGRQRATNRKPQHSRSTAPSALQERQRRRRLRPDRRPARSPQRQQGRHPVPPPRRRPVGPQQPQ